MCPFEGIQIYNIKDWRNSNIHWKFNFISIRRFFFL
jgi:hypothetical protein